MSFLIGLFLFGADQKIHLYYYLIDLWDIVNVTANFINVSSNYNDDALQSWKSILHKFTSSRIKQPFTKFLIAIFFTVL